MTTSPTSTLPDGWHADRPAPIVSHVVFIGDGGAVYDVIEREDKTTDVVGLRTQVRYSSLRNDVEVTGKHRRQPGGVWGARAVLTLDTGEGEPHLIRGIVRG